MPERRQRVQLSRDYDEMSARGADRFMAELRQKPGLLMCAATGSSPLGFYRELARRREAAPDLFARMRVIKLDEWGPLPADEPASCEAYIRREIIEPLRITPDRYLTFAGDAADPVAECARFAETIAQHGPIDFCVLGIGANGHLGLNEPADSLSETVHVAELAEASQQHGMLAGARVQPQYGMTMGMGDILRSRALLLLVSGASKREPMRTFMRGGVTTAFPGSFLWLHGNLTVICDNDAWPE